jgi:hypothetical protein
MNINYDTMEIRVQKLSVYNLQLEVHIGKQHSFLQRVFVSTLH